MKESILAIYNTLGKLQMPMTPGNAKYMAAMYVKLEELYAEADEHEQKEAEHAEDHDE